MRSPDWVIAVDVGGTFTDAIAFAAGSGGLRRSKAYTTPRLIDGISEAVERLGIEQDSVTHVLNGTTVVTNALLTRTGARTAIVTTRGFEDSLESGRERRVGGGLHMYDLRQAGPPPLVERFLRFAVTERIAADGRVLVPLDEGGIAEIAERLKELKVEAVAVAFLFSYINPAHERRAAELLNRLCPGVLVEISSEIAPEIREYERASTTVIDAYTRRPFEDYVASLQGAVETAGSAPRILVMQSSGGLVPAQSDKVRPVQILESGPSAGVIGASWIGNRAGYPNIISFDIGGTTAKACLVRGGAHSVVPEFKADTYYPVRIPSIDLAEIGIGGGSIASIDAGGALRVGPRSAGAEPGPVCYGRGGKDPTVTDAALVLGRLQPDSFLGGAVRLDVEGASDAIAHRIATPLGLGLREAAAGILRIATTQAASAVRLISTKRGFDPRDFAIVAYGGAGPLQAADVALDLGIPSIVVPVGAATFSAFGMLVADRTGDASTTFMSASPESAAGQIEERFRDLEQRAAARIEADPEETTIRRFIDARYVGQRWELSVEVPGGAFREASWRAVVERFHELHHRTYAFSDPEAAVEMVRIHAEARSPLRKPQRMNFAGDAAGGRPIRERQVWDGEAVSPCTVLPRSSLGTIGEVVGRCLIEDADTTIWVPPGARARLDEQASVIIDLRGATHG